MWGTDSDDLPRTLNIFLGWWLRVELYAATNKCVLYDTSIKWCGKVYCSGAVKRDLERASGLANMRQPDTTEELMQFVQVLSWMWVSLLRMAEVVQLLRVLC